MSIRREFAGNAFYSRTSSHYFCAFWSLRPYAQKLDRSKTAAHYRILNWHPKFSIVPWFFANSTWDSEHDPNFHVAWLRTHTLPRHLLIKPRKAFRAPSQRPGDGGVWWFNSLGQAVAWYEITLLFNENSWISIVDAMSGKALEEHQTFRI